MDELNRLHFGDPLSDVNIKLGALSAVIASMIVHCSRDDGTIAKALNNVLRQLKDDISQAKINKSRLNINSEEDTRAMLRKIGILKTY